MANKVALLEEELRQLQVEGARLREQAAVVLANVDKLTPAAALYAAQQVDVATERLAALSLREAGPLWAAWDSPDWADYSGARDTSVLTHVRVAGLLDEEPLPQETQEPDLAWLVPLFAAEGAILVTCDDSTLQAARETVQSLVLRTALAMPSEARLTLVDPVGLGAAFPFRSDLMARLRPTGRTVVDELGEIIDDIRRINERVIGHAGRFANLTREQRAGEAFELVAVVDFPKAYCKDPRAVEHIVRIGNAGPRAGRHLVLEVNLDSPLPHDFELSQLERTTIVDVRSRQAKLDSPPPARRQHELLKATTESGQQQRSGDWDSVVRPDTFLSEDSSRRIETPMGERLRIWLGEGEGKHSSHAIIGGQTGSGKSVLLHVLITGLAARYSPEELRFVLIDGKNGIEFEAYRQLPQAQIICLRTLPAMARSVLADFVTEMEDRYRIFQTVGAVDLEGYRQRTGQSMPRKVLIADEYQQLLDGDEERGGLLLSRVLEKGRAAGTHVVLASQVFNVRGMPANAFSHIETRASLALAPDYVQAIQLFGPEGKRLIRDLAPSGHVVINDRNGGDGSNSRGAVAQCSRKNGADTVLKITQEIIAAVGRPGKPVVINGRDAAVLTDNAFVMSAAGSPPDPLGLQEIARKPTRSGGFGLETWSAADRPVGLWLGRRFDVRGHALCALRRSPSQNLLVLGAHVDVRNRMVASALAALQAMMPMSSLELTLIDGLGAEMPGGGMIRLACEQLAQAGARCIQAHDENLETVLGGLASSLNNPPDPARTRLLIVAEPDYLYALHGGHDRFAPPTSGPAAHLRTLLSRGPQHGLHCVLTASGLAALGTVISPTREARYFNHRAVQQMNEDESMTLFASLSAARIHVQTEHPFAALLVDQIQGVRAGVLFNSYAAHPELNAAQDLAALREQLGALTKQERQAHVA